MMNKKLIYLIVAVVVLLIVAVAGKKAGWFGKGEVEKVEMSFPIFCFNKATLSFSII